MTSHRIATARQIGLILAFAVSLAGSMSTSGFAFTAEQQRMCTGDAFRLCGSEIPDIARITACMRKQRANLSTGCRTVMDRDSGKSPEQFAAAK
jgi:hypothetical protein